jgi:hypothetical protein
MKRRMLKSPLRVATTVTTLGLVLIAIVGFSVNANAWLRSSRRPAPTTKNPGKPQPKPEAASTLSTRTATPQPAKNRIGSELISISRFGFETTEITRPAGKFFLIIENRSGLNPITLRLKAEHGEKVIEVTPPQDQLDWADELNLHPGRYTLTIAERPSWVCNITITRP